MMTFSRGSGVGLVIINGMMTNFRDLGCGFGHHKSDERSLAEFELHSSSLRHSFSQINIKKTSAYTDVFAY
ncbi:hypothetical protein [Bacillus sp. OK048]|uniref:hypothetical protein n=1 Tax=Bacillus sp. OK048 TaxID=1882761 RepID=UPI001C31537A|nr:hypothetical protein [Bacillus sp. OK048]